MDPNKYILLTIDVEDWFQVENFKPWIPFSTWDERELRVEKNVHRLLDLFDSINLAGKAEARGQKASRLESYEARTPGGSENSDPSSFQAPKPPSRIASQPPILPASQLQAERRPKATFFVLGWLAERLPNLVREIQARGHEVASHGYHHELPNSLSAEDLKNDLIDSKKLLEDIIGTAVTGYRAPSFAIDDHILKIIGECGYHYDSSYNSFSLHGRYGKISLNGAGRKGLARRINENFHELPISNLSLSTLGILAHFRYFRHFHLPWGGGAYFRLAPYQIFRRGVQSILKNDGTYVFYIHPWEFDPKQPHVQKASANFRFRHYTNLGKTEDKLRMLNDSFCSCQFITCNQYLSVFA